MTATEQCRGTLTDAIDRCRVIRRNRAVNKSLHCWNAALNVALKDDRQRFLQKVSKKQFRTVYYNANACG